MHGDAVKRGRVSLRNRKDGKINSGVEKKAETPTLPTNREESGTRNQASENGCATRLERKWRRDAPGLGILYTAKTITGTRLFHFARMEMPRSPLSICEENILST